MKLVNQTPAAADAVVALGEEGGPRVGLLTAKVTFHVHPDGGTEIDTQKPFPLFPEEVETDLGLLPSDAVQRRDPAFEVILNGAAHAPGERPVEQMKVELRVGEVSRAMIVTGDRQWQTAGGRRAVTRPVPFTRLPLTFDRAFGGTCGVKLDADTVLEVRDPWNPRGRGFDAEPPGAELGKALKAPRGFPTLVDPVRMLPNLEHPDHRIARWEDAPEPWCWSTVPRDIPFAHVRAIKALGAQAAEGKDLFLDADPDETVFVQLHHRAHPDWILDLPPPRTRVSMRGLTPFGPLEFEIPPVRVIADYVLGDREGARELAPQLMVLLPEEQRLYLVYRTSFTVATEPELERSFRLRLERGWFQYPAPE